VFATTLSAATGIVSARGTDTLSVRTGTPVAGGGAGSCAASGTTDTCEKRIATAMAAALQSLY
jgi:hypothetical protein